MAKKRIAIVKTKDGRFLKYHTSNLPSLLAYKEQHHGGWYYCNVYDKETGLQIANYSYKLPPIRHL